MENENKELPLLTEAEVQELRNKVQQHEYLENAIDDIATRLINILDEVLDEE